MKVVNWIVAVMMSVAIGIVATAAIISYFSFDFKWYSSEYDKYNVCETLNMTKPDLGVVTEKMVGYLKGTEEDLVVETEINGETREFFNDKEKAHLADVKAIYDKIAKTRNIAIVIAVGGGVYFTFAKRKGVASMDYMPKAFGIVGLVFLALMAVIFVALKLNFDNMFIMFHEKMFTNNLWLLDPSKDLLINMLPEGFFVDTAFRIAKYLLLCYLVMAAMFVVMSSVRDTYKEGYASALEKYERENGKVTTNNKKR